VADLYELILSVNLKGDLSDAETAELRWHLGLGPEPAELTIVTGLGQPLIGDDGRPEEDENGDWLEVNQPLLAGNGPAHRLSGVLWSRLERRTDGAWALTSRQEIHPDEFDKLADLLVWLNRRAVDPFGYFHCHARFYENDAFEQVEIVEGEVVWH
jgi:hypothetical protein